MKAVDKLLQTLICGGKGMFSVETTGSYSVLTVARRGPRLLNLQRIGQKVSQ